MVDDRWACFTAKNSNQVWGFAKLQINLIPPTIVLTQDQDSVDATATTHGSIVDDSWQNLITEDSTAPDCDSQDTFGVASSSAKSIPITRSDNNKWVCFRVKNSSDIYGYAKYQIDYNPPIIIISIKDDSLIGTSPDNDLPIVPVWRRSDQLEVSGCNSETEMVDGNVIEDFIGGKYYCMSVADLVGNSAYQEVYIPSDSIGGGLYQTRTAYDTTANPIEQLEPKPGNTGSKNVSRYVTTALYTTATSTFIGSILIWGRSVRRKK